MFSGIVAGVYRVRSVEQTNNGQRFVLDLNGLTQCLEVGASVSVNGVCLTAVAVDEGLVSFDVILATLNRTNLRFLSSDDSVNVERSIRLGDEIGGHLLSGHIAEVLAVVKVHHTSKEQWFSFVVPKFWRKYFHTRGFVALDGVSLTLASFDYDTGTGTVNLVPETLKRTTFGEVSVGSLLNFEVDSATLTVVDSVERKLQSMYAMMDIPKREK